MEPYIITVRNSNNEILKLTQSMDYQIPQYGGGFFPTPASLAFSDNSAFDGGSINSARVSKGNLNLNINIKRNAEANRLKLYKFFRPSSKVRLSYKNGSRDVYIDCVVEDFTPNPFNPFYTSCTAVLVAPNPYWQAMEESVVNYSSVIDNFYFSFPQSTVPTHFSYLSHSTERNIVNDGEVETGFLITMQVNGEMSDPRFINKNTGQFFELDYDFILGDILKINTVVGKKSVILTRNAEDINLFNYVKPNSTWLQLSSGDNIYVYTATEGQTNADFTITHRDLYIGV